MELTYKISKSTLALLPKWDSNGNISTEIFDGFHSFHIDNKPIEIIQHSLLYYGANYSGVVEATKKMMGYTYKIPVCVSLPLNLFIFPLKAVKKEMGIWLVESHIDYVSSYKKDKSIINFSSGISLTVSCSKSIVESNLIRTRNYRLTLLERNRHI